MTTEQSAPKELHDVLDALYCSSESGRRMGAGAQLILGVDDKGKLSGWKMNLAKGKQPHIESA